MQTEEKCNFPNVMMSLHRTKKDMCLKIGASVLIDDNWNYCNEVFVYFLSNLQCKETVQIPIMFGVYGWNRRANPEDYNGIHCCPTWNDVVNLLMKSKI